MHPVPGGKIVWFELPVDVPVGVGEVSDGMFHFDLIGMAQPDQHEPDGTSAQMTVDLLGIPVDLLQKASEEYEELFRELRLMKERADSGIPSAAQLSDRLSVLVSDVGSRSATASARDGRELAGRGGSQGGRL